MNVGDEEELKGGLRKLGYIDLIPSRRNDEGE